MIASELVDDQVVTDGLIEALRTYSELVTIGAAVHQHVGGTVGDGDSPAVATVGVFVEVRQLPDGENPSGGWTQPLGVRGLKYQMHCVGETRQQAQWLGAAVQRFLFEYAYTGAGDYNGFLNPIPMERHTVIHRELVSNVGAVDSGRSPGHMLHVRIRVHRSER